MLTAEAAASRAKRRRRALAAALLALSIGLAGCGNGDSGGEATDPTSGEDGSGTGDDAPGGAVEEPFADLGLDPLELEVAGGDPVTFSWTSVDGADGYSVVVTTADGDPYWAWMGQETEVALGGDAAGAPAGPRPDAGMTATVVALDADGAPLAASAAVALPT